MVQATATVNPKTTWKGDVISFHFHFWQPLCERDYNNLWSFYHILQNSTEAWVGIPW